MKSLLSVLLAVFLVFGCKTKQAILESQPVTIEEETLDTLYVSAPKPDDLKTVEDYDLPVYNESYKKINDLIHTKLDVRFDWEKQRVIGKATLTLKPYFYPTNQLTLDAKGFEINSIVLAESNKKIDYKYENNRIYIELDRTYKSTEEYSLLIDYVAKPAETGGQGGSAAIQSDQGLYFINHDGSIPDKPKQIWTQGETESNSRWFPTIDKPNERCTQEIYLTVEDQYTTLSNGLLLSSEKNSDGTRTDYWKMDKPHAPYLFMVAIGEFAVVEDSWNGMPVNYYVEPKYEPHAKAIYKNTKSMLDFFSDKLDYPFPWQKYSQIVVRDFVSGAMENTSAVIFGDFIQMSERELIDNTINEMIVAHELFHHWFGDLVTCESWANLTMNEGFADYSEYLWFEHEYGADYADFHRYNQLNGYIGQTNRGDAHPLIHFGYDDREDMFDAHSYNKGGLVLHMLRDYVGDEAFWASLNKYLNDNKYTAVEAHDLRLAFEEVIGEDLNWFFNQWYFGTGHPILDIETEYNAETRQVTMTIEQTQDPNKGYLPIFELPVGIDIYLNNGKPIRKNIRIDDRVETFTFDVDQEPQLIVFDADKVLLYEKVENKSTEEYIFQYENAPKLFDRQEALLQLRETDTPGVKALFKKALDDPFWSNRKLGIEFADAEDPEVISKMAQLATKDSHSEVKAAAFTFLGNTGDKQYADIAKQAIDKELAYPVISAALIALTDLDRKAAFDYATRLEKEDDGNIMAAVANVYGASPNPSQISFFEKNWDKVEGYGAISYFEQYSKVLQIADPDRVKISLEKLNSLATNQDISPWKRFSATKTMHELREYYRSDISKGDQVEMITKAIDAIKQQETNDQLKMIYNNF